VIERWEVPCENLVHAHHGKCSKLGGSHCSNSIDGGATLDLMAFRYPVLQPVTNDADDADDADDAKRGGEFLQLPFSKSKGYLLFHISHEGKTGTKFLGRAAFPVSALADDGTSSGDGDNGAREKIHPRCLVLPLTKPLAKQAKAKTKKLNTATDVGANSSAAGAGAAPGGLSGKDEEIVVGELQLVLHLSTQTNYCHDTPWADLGGLGKEATANQQHTLEALLGVAVPPSTPGAGASVTEEEETKVSSASKKHEQSGGYLAQLRKAKQLFLDLQKSLETAADQAERFKNLMNWTQPAKTGIVCSWLFLALLVACAVKTRYLAVGFILKQLQKGYKFRFKKSQTKTQTPQLNLLVVLTLGLSLATTVGLLYWVGGLDTSFFVVVGAAAIVDSTVGKEGVAAFSLDGFFVQLTNLANSVPSDKNLKEMYAQRSAFVEKKRDGLKTVAGHEADSARLQCKWSGFVLVKGRFSGWRKVFLVVRDGIVLFFASRQDALDGHRPVQRLILPAAPKGHQRSRRKVEEIQDAGEVQPARACDSQGGKTGKGEVSSRGTGGSDTVTRAGLMNDPGTTTVGNSVNGQGGSGGGGGCAAEELGRSCLEVLSVASLAAGFGVNAGSSSSVSSLEKEQSAKRNTLEVPLLPPDFAAFAIYGKPSASRQSGLVRRLFGCPVGEFFGLSAAVLGTTTTTADNDLGGGCHAAQSAFPAGGGGGGRGVERSQKKIEEPGGRFD